MTKLYNCHTCGAKVKVGGGDGSTHYYIPVEEESQDEILLTECLEAITKLRPNNAGLGVLKHKLKVRLNKF